MRVHITGGSGSGTTTLGRALGAALGRPHFDADDFYWMPTPDPYTVKRPPAERDRMFREALAAAPDVVLSGAVLSWDLGPRPFDLIVDLRLARRIRLARLRQRECAELGLAAISPGGARRTEYVEFLRWAAKFETGDVTVRSRARVDAWLARFDIPVLVIEGDSSVGERVQRVKEALRVRLGSGRDAGYSM